MKYFCCNMGKERDSGNLFVLEAWMEYREPPEGAMMMERLVKEEPHAAGATIYGRHFYPTELNVTHIVVLVDDGATTVWLCESGEQAKDEEDRIEDYIQSGYLAIMTVPCRPGGGGWVSWRPIVRLADRMRATPPPKRRLPDDDDMVVIVRKTRNNNIRNMIAH